jgi:2-methylaconitate cis-trans-isomerase PrpF
LLNILGSPDPRQVDGLGGGTSATSKTMIIGPSRLEGTDVEMLFGQVSLNSPIVDWRGTCGNLTTAVGPFAIDQGLVKAIEPITEVAIYSLNIRKRLIARVPVNRGRATVQGDYKIPGIRGTGARIDAVRIEMTPPLPGLPRCEGWDFNENISPLKQSTFYETCHLLAALGWQELRRETQGAARK